MIENLDNNAFENQFGRHPPIDGRKSRWRFAGPCANGFNLVSAKDPSAGERVGDQKGILRLPHHEIVSVQGCQLSHEFIARKSRELGVRLILLAEAIEV